MCAVVLTVQKCMIGLTSSHRFSNTSPTARLEKPVSISYGAIGDET